MIPLRGFTPSLLPSLPPSCCPPSSRGRTAMDRSREKNGWTPAVPQFGAWEQKAGGGAPAPTNYSMVFNQARVNRRQQKTELRPYSLGNEHEFAGFQHHHQHQHQHQQHHHHHRHMIDDPAMRKKKEKKLLRYFSCFVTP